MKTYLKLSLLLFALMLSYCKKEKDEIQQPAPLPAQPTPADTSQVDSTSAEILADSCYAFFFNLRPFRLEPNNSLTALQGVKQSATIADSLFNCFRTYPSIYIDTLVCNGYSLNYDGYSFSVPSNYFLYAPFTWTVGSHSTIPPFTHTTYDPYPFYGGYLTLPDTVKTSEDFSLHLTGLSGQNRVRFSIYCNFKDAERIINSDSSEVSVFIPSNETSTLDVNTTGGIVISAIKQQTIFVGGKPHIFQTLFALTKYVYIKP